MKKIAFLFPGQGSQFVGMLNGLMGHAQTAEAIRPLFETARQALNDDIGKLIADGPTECLNLTVNTQPVMLFASLAYFEAWRALGGPVPAWVAGHSLGEYSALAVSGVLSPKDALRLVRLRAEAMQVAVPVGHGAMAAILGLSDEQVLEVCAQATVVEATRAEVVEAVNFNAPAQVAIAGNTAAVERACAIAKEKGAKRALILPVSAPFHSSLMLPAAEMLEIAFQSTAFATPGIPYVNNVDVASPVDASAIKNALVRQAYNPVRWVESIQFLVEQGVTHFVECGPGRVLAGLVKRITDVPVYSLSDATSIHDTVRILT
ncbi:MAG: ACP S-malonyltransferase [Burkholderiaceae bacterium]